MRKDMHVEVMEQGTSARSKLPIVLFFLAIFLYLYVFHTQIHPVYIFSGDDWTYMSRGREAIPSMKEWDPARIFPETVMPTVASFAVYFVKPIVGDYLLSLSVTYAGFLSLVVTVYVFSVYRLMKTLFALSDLQAGVVSTVYLFFHYYCFASLDAENLHLLYVYDLANVFYYMMPTLTNLILLLLLQKAEQRGSRVFRNPLLKGLFFFFLYIALFSHLYCSYLLALYAFLYLIKDLMAGKRGGARFSLRGWARKNALYFVILAGFLISVFMEGGGTRAGNMPEKSSPFPLAETVTILFRRLYYVKKSFLLVTVIIFVAAFCLHYREVRRGEAEDMLFEELKQILVLNAAALFLSLLYIILLSTVSNPNYVKRMDVLFGPMFFLLTGVVSALSYILKKQSQVIAIIPLALFIGASTIWSIDGRTFRGNENPKGWIALENYHIQQFVEADQAGAEKVTLDLVDIYEESWFGDRIAITLYKHGIVSRRMKVETHVEPELKERFHLRPPLMPWAEDG